jgi:hypothetical protein
MNSSFIVKALVNTILSWLLIALVFSLKKDISYVDALAMPYIILVSVVAGVASYFGMLLRNRK